jgi:hypothetical protein
MIALCFSMQREDIFEHNNGKCHAYQYAREKIFLSKPMAGFMRVHFNELVDHCGT